MGVPFGPSRGKLLKYNLIVKNHANSIRQVNQDGSKKHRLFIQPLGKKGGGTSHASKTGSAGYLAQVHLSDPTDPQTVRDTLWLSWADDKGKTVKKLPWVVSESGKWGGLSWEVHNVIETKPQHACLNLTDSLNITNPHGRALITTAESRKACCWRAISLL